jgi:aminoglycoside phosphotransferase (APT) family kinase protein
MTETLSQETVAPEEQLGALIGRGRTAEVYHWGPEQVVKLFPATVPAELIEHEVRVAAALLRAGVPAPRYAGRVQVGNCQGLLFARVAGPSMLEVLTRRPWLVLALASQLAEVHLAMHRQASDADLPSQRAALRTAIEVASGLPEAIRAHALQLLRAVPDGDRICHGDFHPDNVLLTSAGPVVIDWMTATRGCPAADVARTLLLLRQGGLPPGTSTATALLARGTRRVVAWRYWHCYQAGSPVRATDLAPWWVPVMAARLRETVPADERQRLLRWLATTLPGGRPGGTEQTRVE